MPHEVVQKVAEIAPQLAATAEETERLGRLADESVKLMREAGVMRLLQPTDFGGYAAHPRDFAEAVMAVAAQCGSTGWVCGGGGVHPWEMALMDRKLHEEVWGTNPDTWIADSRQEITFADRAAQRRNQVRCAWRPVAAVDEIFARSGGNAVRRQNVMQRFWRDAHVGLQHAIHVPGGTYHATALTTMGVEPEGMLRALI